MLSKRIQTLSSSLTIAITTLAQELKAEGKDILSFSAGEPDFDTPAAVKNAAKDALDAGKTKYTAVPGVPELLTAVSDKLKRDNNLDYTPKMIQTNNGAKHSLFNLLQALIDEGDEVIIFNNELHVSTLAINAETIPYEIFTSIGERVGREYLVDL